MDRVTPSFATDTDIPEIWDFMSGDFLENESLNGALQMKKEESRVLFFYLIRKGVSSGTSVLLKNEKGTIVGLRLSSFLDRDGETESDENEENLQFSQKAETIDGLLSVLGEARWDRIPREVSRCFYILVISVHSAYTRRGLGKVLLEFGMDRVREAGATGILSEATALKSQALFAKHGYRILKEVKHADHVDKDGKRIFTCTDGTNCAQLVFRYIDKEID
ncbi:hypothetical protein PRIPAC_86366 [Pristionchus pacificus]|uniref:aralkylamine N-acetyltransferase n=1 Tax=Pristionchus pacificus TaxID=54126 RepID=A0A2A6BSU3_PRIPA|nr:hypothetical protein PRIPAC_86366 [Pristionchus pacificus]|eukprot:PDM68958.1 Acetyltransferase [Pristionchus pacificus]